ncbi:hypothetical protein GCM10011608_40660 [Micromonospora sonchi]|uniref:Uncharacterized protein n=1 Tax=Micromonospora sonchi TaxID=1763543 RepID=A0A917X176_9ACTN|nr:hypothetical protein GCM10011608_40660 [Micromonospora sonchi]
MADLQKQVKNLEKDLRDQAESVEEVHTKWWRVQPCRQGRAYRRCQDHQSDQVMKE